jgi:misacylated tRNA(Ala) deacylase
LTELVYQSDSYLREIEARVVNLAGNKVYLDKTIFHPKSGGVDNDKGFIFKDSFSVRVESVYYDRETGDIAHEITGEPQLNPGDIVKLVLDWDRRYRLMRLHTAAHIISAIMYNDFHALITGGNVSPDYAYDDYSLEAMDKTIFQRAIEKANGVVKKALEVKVYWLPYDEAMRMPGIVKLASRAPPRVEKLRIVEIPGVDIQADGGPHVKNTAEIGEIELIKVENKGKGKKRLYFTVKP